MPRCSTAIADWAERYTPLVALDPPHGLMLDITGCRPSLRRRGSARRRSSSPALAAQGFFARAAIADTPGAASAAARFGGAPVVAAGRRRPRCSRPCRSPPSASIRETVFALERVGLKRIGQIIEAPRAPLAARFGASFIRRLDQALGREEEAISPRRPLAAADRRAPLRRADLARGGHRRDPRLACRDACRGAWRPRRGRAPPRARPLPRRRRGDAAPQSAPAGRCARRSSSSTSSARNSPASARRSTPASASTWCACRSAPPPPPIRAQIDLAGDAVGEADLDRLIDRIGARLGPERVSRIVPQRQPHPGTGDADADVGGEADGTIRPVPSVTAGIRSLDAAHRPPAPPLREARAGGGDRRGAGRAAGPFPLAARALPRRPRRRPGAHRRRMVARRTTTSPATISASRIPPATASGSSAKASTAARRRPRAGTCTGCSRDANHPASPSVSPENGNTQPFRMHRYSLAFAVRRDFGSRRPG